MLLAGVVIVALVLVAVGVGYGYLQFRFSQVTKVTVEHLKVSPPGLPFNVLLIGSDSRAHVPASQESHYGDEEPRADNGVMWSRSSTSFRPPAR